MQLWNTESKTIDKTHRIKKMFYILGATLLSLFSAILIHFLLKIQFLYFEQKLPDFTSIFWQFFKKNYHPRYTPQEFDITTHKSAGGDALTRPSHKGDFLAKIFSELTTG
jgi:ssDNA-specific exonuclease RecJ